MRYVIFIFIVSVGFNCSPKIAPDMTWSRQRWVLTEMRGVPVQLSGGRRDAYINFEPIDKRFAGNGGCNQITGNYRVSKNSIQFVDVTSTKMSCEDIGFENTFLSTLSKVNRYEVRGNDILLKRKKDILLVLTAR